MKGVNISNKDCKNSTIIFSLKKDAWKSETAQLLQAKSTILQ